MSRSTLLARPLWSLHLDHFFASRTSTSPCRTQLLQQRHLTTRGSKSSPADAGMPATPQSLELLKRTLQEKKNKLNEILERQGNTGSSMAMTSTSAPIHPSSSSGSNHASKDTDPSQQSKPRQSPDRSMPMFAAPADMSVRLPKVFRDFDQPKDAEIVKIAIIGSPNAGKSTIVNDLVKNVVSVVSIRAHTTRERIKAVLTERNKQAVFYDTPGVVPEKNVSRLNRELVTASWKAIEEADHLLLVMDCNKLLKHTLVSEAYIFERLEKLERKIPATLVFNKMDLVKGRDEKLQTFVEDYSQRYPNFVKTIFTSAETPKIGLQELRTHLLSFTQPGPWLYPAFQKSDQSDLGRVEDLIRSELYAVLKVPYSVKQKNVGWTELEDNVLRIDQNLVVDRPGLKKIIVGSQGSVIRDLTLNAKRLIETALRRRVMLNLQVKVKANKS